MKAINDADSLTTSNLVLFQKMEKFDLLQTLLEVSKLISDNLDGDKLACFVIHSLVKKQREIINTSIRIYATLETFYNCTITLVGRQFTIGFLFTSLWHRPRLKPSLENFIIWRNCVSSFGKPWGRCQMSHFLAWTAARSGNQCGHAPQNDNGLWCHRSLEHWLGEMMINENSDDWRW